jgi:hypothetical protein
MSVMSSRKIACFVVVAAFILAAAGQASAAFIGTLGTSADFTYKYEMDVMPTAQDLDGNSLLDMEAHESTPGNISVSGGLMTLIGSTGGSDYIGCDGMAAGVWQNKFASGDYTVEWSAKVTSAPGGTGGEDGAFILFASNGLRCNPVLSGTDIKWSNPATSIYTGNSMDVFHVYRVAQQGTSFYIWRDGVLIGDGLSNGAGSSSMYFGDGSGAINGTTQVDYLRLQAGAYAPLPEPSSIIVLATALISLLAYAWRKRK